MSCLWAGLSPEGNNVLQILAAERLNADGPLAEALQDEGSIRGFTVTQ